MNIIKDIEKLKIRWAKEKELKQAAKLRQTQIVADLSCSVCGCLKHTDIEFDSYTYFVINDIKTYVEGNMCTNCGHIDLFRKIE